MTALSTFQTLPWHIIESVVEFHINMFTINYNSHKTLAASILHSCHGWRSTFIRKTCSLIHLDFRNSSTLSFSFPNWPRALKQPDILAGRFVKTVLVHMDLLNLIMDDGALLQLLQSPLIDFVFSAALTLRFETQITFSYLMPAPINSAFGVQDATAFFRKIRQMTPTIQKIDVLWPDFPYQYTNGQYSIFLDRITEEVFQGVNEITIRQMCTSVYCSRGLTSAVPSGVTQLVFCGSSNSVWIAESIQQSVASLKTLSLRYPDIQTATALLRNAQGAPVIYQYLESFEHISRDDPDVSAGLELPAAAVVSQPTDTTIYFPALKYFKLSGPYPFVDDAPFRGNSPTLERLDINITHELIDIADKFCIFTGCKFSSVQYIGLTYATPYLITRQDPETRFQEFLLQILPALGASTRIHTFKLLAHVDKDMMFKCIQELSVSNRLQVIEFPIVSLEFAVIVAIMRHAPYLQKLSCLPTNVAPSIDGIGDNKIWRHVNGISGTFGKHFRWLALDSGSRTMTMNGSKTIALITIACPQFIGVKLSFFDRRKYKKNIDRLAGYKYLSEFADRFKLFGF